MLECKGEVERLIFGPNFMKVEATKCKLRTIILSHVASLKKTFVILRELNRILIGK